MCENCTSPSSQDQCKPKWEVSLFSSTLSSLTLVPPLLIIFSKTILISVLQRPKYFNRIQMKETVASAFISRFQLKPDEAQALKGTKMALEEDFID